jgi:signal peptidase I
MEETKQKKKVSAKKIISIILDVFVYAFLVLAIVVVALTIMSKVAQKDDPNGAPNLFGYEMRYVETGSMEPAYPVNTMVFIEKAPSDNKKFNDSWCKKVKVGDVLTFYYKEANQKVVITHRVVSIEPNDEKMEINGLQVSKGGYIIKLEGDNKGDDGKVMTQTIYTYAHNNPMAEANDQLQGQIIGKVVGQSVVLGNIVTTLKNPLGMVLIIIVPCLAVIIIEVVRVIKVFNAEKSEKAKKKQAEQQEKLDKQTSEIELLKQQLALLQQQSMGASVVADKPEQVENAEVEVEESSEVVKEAQLVEQEAEQSVEQIEEAENETEEKLDQKEESEAKSEDKSE